MISITFDNTFYKKKGFFRTPYNFIEKKTSIIPSQTSIFLIKRNITDEYVQNLFLMLTKIGRHS